jgi:rubrerythrin
MRTLLATVLVSMMAVAVGCQKDDMDHHHNDKMKKSDSSMTSGKTMGTMDACSHCAGVQTATADGKCPVCGMKVTGGGNAK